MGDITKPHAEKMEYISHVADGDDEHKIKNGYWLLGASAINISRQDKTPLPIHLEIFSTEEVSHKSENTKIISLFENIYSHHNQKNFENRPTIAMDRGGDRIVLLKTLINLNLPFVIRLDKRYLKEKDTEKIIKIGQRNLNRNELLYSVTIKRTENNNKTANSNVDLILKK